MKFTCLSEGKGYYFPPCNIMDICGFRILFDCPLDLSSLSIFSPVVPVQWSTFVEEDISCACHTSLASDSDGEKIEKPLDVNSLIHAEPRYNAVRSLSMLDVSFIDVVLISSPMGMLGLPLLTRREDFSAKIYTTEASMRLGQLMMEDILMMHKELRQFYGPEDPTGPEWMKWDEIGSLPSALKEMLLGQDGSQLGGWVPLYSAADLNDCIQKVQSLKYAEEACYNGTLIIKAFSSGLDIGTSNWTIISPKQNVAYISSSICASTVAMNFDYNALQGMDVILFSDFAPCLDKSESENHESTFLDHCLPNLSDNDKSGERVTQFLLTSQSESAEELEKLAFLCSCSLDCVRLGGSVLIPIGRLGIILQLLEQISVLLESSDLKVPILMVSSVAEELLEFLNVIPEWLCQQHQNRLFSDQPLFFHVHLLKEKKICLYPAIHSPKLLENWQEPCIVFCPHWSLRLGPAVHLLRRWSHNENSLLVVEEAADMDLVILPFKPMKMKVLQCSFLSGMKLQTAKALLEYLKPKHVLLPEKLKEEDNNSMSRYFTLSYYSENETLHIPKIKDGLELDIGLDLACRLRFTKLEEEDMSIARLKGELSRECGKIRLLAGNIQVLSSQTKPLLYLGRVKMENLLDTLEKSGMKTRVEKLANEQESGSEMTSFSVRVMEPKEALIEVTESHTVIGTADDAFASCISEAISSILDCN